jgi:ferrous iron transport protein A
MESTTLLCLKPNKSCTIKEITSCGMARRRLCELGLNKGTPVKVIKNDLGPIILNIYGHKLALGRGLAQKILVEC